MKFLNKFGLGTYQGLESNQYSSKPNCYRFVINDVDKFNEIYQYLYNSDLNKLVRTESGAIAKGLNIRANRYAWDLVMTNSGCRITVCIDGLVYVFKVGMIEDYGNKVMQPYKAFNIFEDKCYDAGIDLEQYAIENGEEVKQEIESPLIIMYNIMTAKDKPIEHVNHIDFHNSYPAGLANTHPEFRPIIEELYKERKYKPEYKAVLNYTIGCMQSLKNPWNARWAHLSRDAIKDNNDRIVELAYQLKITGHEILGFNTDGIWYKGPVYHGSGEGDDLGQWHNDHIDCLFRSKSNGSYEFIENGDYHPVVRGITNLDLQKPREEWQWGDIYQENATIIEFTFEEGIGIKYETTKESH